MTKWISVFEWKCKEKRRFGLLFKERNKYKRSPTNSERSFICFEREFDAI
jgi:hypothetical protein